MALDYTERLRQLVGTPSVSCTAPDKDMANRPVIDLLAGWLDDLGFATEVLPVPGCEGKANLIATLGSGPGGLVLSGHTDTVPFDEQRWQQDPFTLTERDQRLYGLGATDMKGFFPAAIEASLEFLNTPLKQPLIILATADEETSMSGARALAEAGAPRARYAVIGEPTELVPVRMHKGIMMEAVRVEGRSGHSSNPALGVNALEAMHSVLGELLRFRNDIQQRYRHEGFEVSFPTLNPGCIHGGDNPNRICGQCELFFDLRILPGMDNDDMRKQLRQRLTPLAQKSGTTITLRSLVEGVDPFEEAADSSLVKTCEQLTGHSAKGVAFATEAPFLHQLGMETVVMGPGSINQAHQPDEFIALDQIQPAIDTLKALIRRFCL